MKKMIIDCSTGKSRLVDMTIEETQQRQADEVEYLATLQKAAEEADRRESLKQSVVGMKVSELTEDDRNAALLVVLDKLGLVNKDGVIR